MKRLSPMQQELYRRIDEVLHYVWDPIGVSGDPAARDEYDTYLSQVFSLAVRGAVAKDIAVYLTDATVQQMGLSAREEHDLHVAELVVAWREALKRRWS
ncbi:MAG: hypothetical protein Q4G39_04265 [Brachymonas sp.]|nr:hypothetical protein [Brachymonas sp.]